MCGIFALLNNDHLILKNDIIYNEFMKGKNRGPETSKFVSKYDKLLLGFHRLAINGLNELSNQPLKINNVILICNGEIYNYKYLYKFMNIEPSTDSDCEVIIHLYLKYGIEQTLNMLDGVFSFVLYDNNINNENNTDSYIYIARDPLGVRPLYKLTNKFLKKQGINYIKKNKTKLLTSSSCLTLETSPKFFINNSENKQLLGFSSELKTLEYFYNLDNENFMLTQHKPGSYSVLKLSSKINSYWSYEIQECKYYNPLFPSTTEPQNKIYSLNLLDDYNYFDIAYNLELAVKKRCLTTERPIACLLSGGLDSSLISALVANHFRDVKNPEKSKIIETYSIGLEGSEDLIHAKIVADYIGSNHHEIIVTSDEMFQVIPEVIKAIESYDITTVRASLGNYLIGKFISQNSQAKVIFNGDGSDELFGGYLYMNKCPDIIEFDREIRRLLNDIHLYDVLRSDKCISSNGLEPRTPFLDKTFVNLILSLPLYYRNHNNFGCSEKYLLRNAFREKYFRDNYGRQILPDNILYRKKEAFSDGVSSKEKSLYLILQEMISKKLNNELIPPLEKVETKMFNSNNELITPLEKVETKMFNSNNEIKNNIFIKYKPNIETEKYYYLKLFNEFFKNCQHIIPYYWMPKYTNASDPSARTLTFYN